DQLQTFRVSERTSGSASPLISQYLWLIGCFGEPVCLLSLRRTTLLRQETREFVGVFWAAGPRRSGLGGPRGDAAWVTRCGGACQAGGARALAAAARRLAAQPQALAGR